LQKHAFKQKQRGISSLPSVGTAGLLMLFKQYFNRIPVNSGIYFARKLGSGFYQRYFEQQYQQRKSIGPFFVSHGISYNFNL
jgi:hypothetical protein